MGEAEPLKLEISSSGEEDTDDEVIAEKKQAKERMTGQLDFDYEPVLLVQTSGQMKNQVANMAKHLWEVLQHLRRRGERAHAGDGPARRVPIQPEIVPRGS